MTERRAAVSKYPVKIANQWLSTAKDGFCAATTGPGNCEVDNMGSFAIAPHERDYFKTWTRAAQLCLQKCSECRRCGMVSISIKDVDCSWYRSCRKLSTIYDGFRSGALVLDPTQNNSRRSHATGDHASRTHNTGLASPYRYGMEQEARSADFSHGRRACPRLINRVAVQGGDQHLFAPDVSCSERYAAEITCGNLTYLFTRHDLENQKARKTIAHACLPARACY